MEFFLSLVTFLLVTNIRHVVTILADVPLKLKNSLPPVGLDYKL
ncbi:MAG: hypothetical protein QOJ02_114 [Acidobacteriota bacterium]|jgi:hypothetical protein|nr:hypothetical protein [Acidobacteriota bacterium]